MAVRKPRKKKLWKNKTEEEYLKSLLLNPPTEKTWYHEGVYEREDSLGNKVAFRHVNSGDAKKCWLCSKARPAKPKLLWSDYVRACEKVGIEPGFVWMQKENGAPIMRVKGGGWRTAPELP